MVASCQSGMESGFSQKNPKDNCSIVFAGWQSNLRSFGMRWVESHSAPKRGYRRELGGRTLLQAILLLAPSLQHGYAHCLF
jgi:hypothetical protein